MSSSLYSSKLLIPSQLNVNNFDLLRLLLAVCVLYSHCYIISQGSMENEPVYQFSSGQTELAVLAVYGFFIISGFLITRSFEQTKTLRGYLQKRVLRIVPGFAIAFLLSALVIGPIGTIDSGSPHGNPAAYFGQTRWHGLLLDLLTLQPPHVANCFMMLAVPKQVNASLWTIQHEALCYILVPVLAAAGLFTRRWVLPVAIALVFICMVALDLPILAAVRESTNRIINWPGYFPKFVVYFLAGAFCYLNRDQMIRNRWLALAAGAITIITARTGGFHFVFPFAGTYLLFYLAYHPRIRFAGFARYGDLSYGTYLYAWPVQLLTWFFLGEQLTIFWFFFISLFITLIIASGSWHLVERPFLQKKFVLSVADKS